MSSFIVPGPVLTRSVISVVLLMNLFMAIVSREFIFLADLLRVPRRVSSFSMMLVILLEGILSRSDSKSKIALVAETNTSSPFVMILSNCPLSSVLINPFSGMLGEEVVPPLISKNVSPSTPCVLTLITLSDFIHCMCDMVIFIVMLMFPAGAI